MMGMVLLCDFSAELFGASTERCPLSLSSVRTASRSTSSGSIHLRMNDLQMIQSRTLRARISRKLLFPPVHGAVLCLVLLLALDGELATLQVHVQLLGSKLRHVERDREPLVVVDRLN